jgi:uncharacterized protein DUF3105
VERAIPKTVLVALCFLVSLVLAACSEGPDKPDRQEPDKPSDGVESFENLGKKHVKGTVNYDRSPPVGGNHNPTWQNCGYYAQPVPDERAVHSMEHGAVWIAYSPDLPQEQVQRLRDLAQNRLYVLVSPYPDLGSPVVASAWGKQLRLDGASDPDLERFVRAYSQGTQAPEPGAPCTGGLGSPQ